MDVTEIARDMENIRRQCANRYGHGALGTMQLIDIAITLTKAVDALNKRIEELEQQGGNNHAVSTRTITGEIGK